MDQKHICSSTHAAGQMLDEDDHNGIAFLNQMTMLDACVQALHRNHSPPTGAHVTGDAQTGFALHIRPIDDTNAANGVLRRFMDVCGGNRQPQVSGTVSDAAPQRPASASPQSQPSTGAPQSSPAGPATSGPPPLAQPPPFNAPSGRMTTAWGPPPPSRKRLIQLHANLPLSLSTGPRQCQS